MNRIQRFLMRDESKGGLSKLGKLTLISLIDGPAFQGDVGKSLGIDPMTMSQAVRHLMGDDLIKQTPDESDKRRKNLSLTGKGKNKINGFLAEVQKKVDKMGLSKPLSSSTISVREAIEKEDASARKSSSAKGKAPQKKKSSTKKSSSARKSAVAVAVGAVVTDAAE